MLSHVFGSLSPFLICLVMIFFLVKQLASFSENMAICTMCHFQHFLCSCENVLRIRSGQLGRETIRPFSVQTKLCLRSVVFPNASACLALRCVLYKVSICICILYFEIPAVGVWDSCVHWQKYMKCRALARKWVECPALYNSPLLHFPNI